MTTTPADSKFAVAFVINFVLAVIFLSIFLFFKKRVPKVYEARCDGSPKAPKSPAGGIFGWAISTIKYSDDQLYTSHGMDALMFVKFLKCMWFIVVAFCAYNVVVLFPVDATGEHTVPQHYNDTEYVQGLERLTLSAIGAKSNRMIAHLISVVFNTCVVFFFTHRLYKEYMQYRIRTKREIDRVENYAVMIREVPIATGSEEQLKEYFSNIYHGEVLYVVRARNTGDLIKKLAERNGRLRNIERADAILAKTGERPIAKTKLLFGEKVDAIDWHTENFEKLSKEVETMQGLQWPGNGVVFVVFAHISTAMQCAQTNISNGTQKISEAAPEPRDIRWDNLQVGHNSRVIRSLIVNVFTFFLVFFWIIPVVFVSGLSNLTTLSKIPGFIFLAKLIELNQVLNGFVQGFLPTLALIIFFAVLIMILTAVSSAQGLYTHSRIARSVLSKYYVFEIFNIFLVYSISGSIFNTIKEVVANPQIVISLLAQSLPKQSTFFTNYIMILSMGGHCLALARLGPLIVRWIKHKFLSKTPREFKEAEFPGSFAYHTSFATHLLIFAIVCCYSTLAPFILPWAFLYFSLAFLSQKYLIVYVAIPLYESGGMLFVSAFNRIYVGLFIYQIVMVGEFIQFQFIAGIVISALCAASTLLFWNYTHNQFGRASINGALEEVNTKEGTPLMLSASNNMIPDQGTDSKDKDFNIHDDIELQKSTSSEDGAIMVPIRREAFTEYDGDITKLTSSDKHFDFITQRADTYRQPALIQRRDRPITKVTSST